ncbi:MAG TPA: zinc ribbon domain-containing protein [Candidatus Limnocylindria bacterium]|nr:zinc ribbon domain-containing protein [Candidatus Limnocylindria bacterium]
MADHFCPSCGTEVESDARFCPSCGTTLALEDGPPTGADAPLPPAPAWPSDDVMTSPEPTAADEPTLTAAPPAQPAVEPEPADVALAGASAPPPPPAAAAAPGAKSATTNSRSSDVPITWPTTVAGWLIGAGSLLGAIFLISNLGNVVSLLLFVALLGVAASVFLAEHMPDIPRLRVLVLVTTMIGLGVALARAGFTVAGVDTLFLLAMLAAGGGALLIEFDRDRPWPPPERNGG